MTVAEKAYDEMIDLFARGCNAESILSFRPSAKSQRRVRDLLELSKHGQLTAEDSAELDRLGDIEHLMQLVKARARMYLDQQS